MLWVGGGWLRVVQSYNSICGTGILPVDPNQLHRQDACATKMEPFTPIFEWIDSQAARMRSLVESWAGINSYSYNLAGLEALSSLLRDEWRPLGEVTEHSLAPQRSVDERGHVTLQPL